MVAITTGAALLVVGGAVAAIAGQPLRKTVHGVAQRTIALLVSGIANLLSFFLGTAGRMLLGDALAGSRPGGGARVGPRGRARGRGRRRRAAGRARPPDRDLDRRPAEPSRAGRRGGDLPRGDRWGTARANASARAARHVRAADPSRSVGHAGGA